MRKASILAILGTFLVAASIFAASCSSGSGESEAGMTVSPTQTVRLATPAVSLPTPTATATLVPTSIPTPTVVPTPIPTSTPEPEPIQEVAVPEPEIVTNGLTSLKLLLEQEVAEYPDWWVSTCVTDLQTSETICIDENSQRDTGCVIDLFALFVAVEEFEAGRASPEDYIESAGTSIATQIRAGIGSSSPNNAAIFLAAVKEGSLAEGTYRAREIVVELGLADTIFGYVPYNQTEADFPPNLTTARDINAALTKLWNGEIFSPGWTDYAIGVLTDSEYTDTMPDLVQHKGARVAHKIGYFGYESGYNFAVWNDVGVVYWEKDGVQLAFALSVFSQGPWAGKSIVANLADISYDWFDAKY